jgi:hypothetical protein
MILSVACLAAPDFYILSLKRRDFRKKVTERKICFHFISILLWSVSYSKRNSAIYCHKCENVFVLSTTRYSGQILRKLEFSRQILEECSDTTFHQNSLGGNRVVPFGRTHRHDEANESLFAVLRMRVTSRWTVWQQAVAPPPTCLSYRVTSRFCGMFTQNWARSSEKAAVCSAVAVRKYIRCYIKTRSCGPPTAVN